MDVVKIFSRETPKLSGRLPSGSFTVDSEGSLIASTLPHTFPEEQIRDIAARILEIFRWARTADLPLMELSVNFAALKITARELRGGAIIFLAPETPK